MHTATMHIYTVHIYILISFVIFTCAALAERCGPGLGSCSGGSCCSVAGA